jgi:hypothetical protein
MDLEEITCLKVLFTSTRNLIEIFKEIFSIVSLV